MGEGKYEKQLLCLKSVSGAKCVESWKEVEYKKSDSDSVKQLFFLMIHCSTTIEIPENLDL